MDFGEPVELQGETKKKERKAKSESVGSCDVRSLLHFVQLPSFNAQQL